MSMSRVLTTHPEIWYKKAWNSQSRTRTKSSRPYESRVFALTPGSATALMRLRQRVSGDAAELHSALRGIGVVGRYKSNLQLPTSKWTHLLGLWRFGAGNWTLGVERIAYFLPASKIFSDWIDHAGAPAVSAVCVRRTNFPCTGANAIVVVAPLPSPWATVVQVEPSIDTSTL